MDISGSVDVLMVRRNIYCGGKRSLTSNSNLDVINVSGHRLSTAEIESALVHHETVAEAAVVGGNDDLTGQCIHAFVSLKPGVEANDTLDKELILQVRKMIGPFAAPKRVHIVNDHPKTRSGKIMRRILRKIVNGEQDQLGDISTLADPL